MTPVFGGRPGLWREYEGGYEVWKEQRERSRVALPMPAGDVGAQAAAPRGAGPQRAAPRAKLSYKEQRELEGLPQRIEALETEQRDIAARLADPQLYVRESQRAADLSRRHAEIEEQLMACLERWEALAAR